MAHGVRGSALGLVGPVSIYCDYVRWKVGSATSVSVWQHVKLFEQIRPWDTLACCWEVKQPTNKHSSLAAWISLLLHSFGIAVCFAYSAYLQCVLLISAKNMDLYSDCDAPSPGGWPVICPSHWSEVLSFQNRQHNHKNKTALSVFEVWVNWEEVDDWFSVWITSIKIVKRNKVWSCPAEAERNRKNLWSVFC